MRQRHLTIPLNILFVAPYVPSPVRVRPFAFIQELFQRGHRITLVCLVQPKAEARYLDGVRPYCASLHPIFLNRIDPYLRTIASLPTREPLSVAYCHSTELRRQVHDLVAENGFDLIHTEFLRAAPATSWITGHPKVFDAVDSLWLTYQRSLSAAYVSPMQRLIALIEWAKMRSFEPRLLTFFDRVVVSSPADQAALERNGQNQIIVIPNGVDTRYFAFQEGPRDPATLVFLGKMSYYVNVASVLWFYHRVLPLIRRHRPQVRFKILGRDPAPAISRLAEDPCVVVTGTVPDVRSHLAKATACVCPMVSGAGIQNKMLEAMAVGTPCVATSLATHALHLQSGREALIADKAEDYANAVLELLDCPEWSRQIAEHGRRYVEEYHGWDSVGDLLEQLYISLLDREQEVSGFEQTKDSGHSDLDVISHL